MPKELTPIPQLVSPRDGELRIANQLIQKSKYTLSLTQLKILAFLMAQVKATDTEFKRITFSIKDFCELCGIDTNSGRNYTRLKEDIKAIAKDVHWVTIEEEDNKEKLVRWLDEVEITPNSGEITIRLSKTIEPYLLKLKGKFTKLDLVWLIHSKRKYTFRLYMLVKSIHFHDLEEYERRYELDELKRILGAETHKTFQNFRNRALQPAVDEINQYSDKNVAYEPIVEKNKTVAVKLIVSSKNSMEALRLRSSIEKEMGLDNYAIHILERDIEDE